MVQKPFFPAVQIDSSVRFWTLFGPLRGTTKYAGIKDALGMEPLRRGATKSEMKDFIELPEPSDFWSRTTGPQVGSLFHYHVWNDEPWFL